MAMICAPYKLMIILLLVVLGLGRANDDHRFLETYGYLDKDGDMLFYMEKDALLKQVQKHHQMLRQYFSESASTSTRKTMWDQFVEHSGILEMDAVGLSSKKQENGTYRSRLVLHRPFPDAPGAMWDLCNPVGTRKSILPYLPITTVAAIEGQVNLTKLWKGIMTTIRDQESKDWLERIKLAEKFGATEDLSIEGLLNNYDDQLVIAMMLDEEETINLQIGGGARKIPRPDFLIGLRMKDDMLVKKLDDLVTRYKLPMHRKQVNGGKQSITSFENLGISSFGWGIAWCQLGDWLLVSTATDVLEATIVNRISGSGLGKDEAYSMLRTSQPQRSELIGLLHPTLTKTVARLITDELQTRGSVEQAEIITKLTRLETQPLQACFSAEKIPGGYRCTTTSNLDAVDLFLTALTLPAILAKEIPELAETHPGGPRIIEHMECLKRINIGLMVFSADHEGQFPYPTGVGGLGSMAKHWKKFDTAYLVSPWDKSRKSLKVGWKKIEAEHSSFLYFGNGFKTDDEYPGITPICIDRPGLNPNGVCALFIDGHVEFFPGEFEDAEAFIRHITDKLNIPNKRSNILLKKVAEK